MNNLNTYHKLPILDGLELLHAYRHTLDFPYHTHTTFNIALILSQPFNTKLTDKFLQAPAGTLSITNPHEVHATPCDSKAGNSFFTFYVPPDVLKNLNKGCDVFFRDKIIYDEALFNDFRFISLHLNDPLANTEKQLLSCLQRLVTGYAAGENFKYREVNLFRSFIEEDLSDKFSLTDTAARFGIDKFKFLRLFKHETGLTPNNYLILKRIEKSKQLLAVHEDLTGIALEAGFYDAAHLCRHFKRFTGVTPLEYRNA